MKLKTKREILSINTSAIAEDRTEASFNLGESEAVNINDFIKDSFLDGEVKRMDSQNKIENKDTSSITYSRTFSQEKAVNTVNLNRLDT